MSDLEQHWAERILSGDRLAIARAISAVENGEPAGRKLVQKLFGQTGRAFVVGVTGAPGAGKSTLVDKLAAEFRREGKQVGILAVDPTSPFSGGAILGDRIRMQHLSTDDGVYIRSMATRGQLGGLAPAAYEAVSILDAAGCDAVVIETVGVGQDEVEIARLADATVLLLVPGMGDDVQTFKAGVMEIADLFVINKADRPGADRVEQELTAMLSIAPREEQWAPPILNTVATTGEGVPRLKNSLDEFRSHLTTSSRQMEKARNRCKIWLLELLRRRLYEEVVSNRTNERTVNLLLDEILARRLDPYSAVERLLHPSAISEEKP